jgi:hypothetical protein
VVQWLAIIALAAIVLGVLRQATPHLERLADAARNGGAWIRARRWAASCIVRNKRGLNTVDQLKNLAGSVVLPAIAS